MRNRGRLLFGILCVAAVMGTGCQRWRERWRNRDPYSAYSNDPFFHRRDQYVPGYPAPYPYYGSPPAGIPVAPSPPGAAGAPGMPSHPGAPGAPEVLTPQPPPVDMRQPNSSMYRSPSAGMTPRNSTPSSPRSPSTAEPPLAKATPPTAKNPAPAPKQVTVPPDLAEPRKAEPPATIPPQNVPDRSWALPVGIPFYFEVKEGQVATGHRPDTEGLDWLKSRGFKTIIQLRRPGKDTTADREQIEKRGMQYVVLDVVPENFNRKLVDEFGALLADRTRQPLFVYDDDGIRVGALWYAHLRLSEKLPDDLARTRAELYGFKETGSTEAEELGVALKKLLGLNH